MSKPLIDRYFCHYELLEEYHSGLWRTVSGQEKQDGVMLARAFMSDTEKFAGAMSVVCETWKNSCAYNFTNPTINSVAWLGQSAVCSATGLPEMVTRAAWGELEFKSQELANAAARSAIKDWYKENSQTDQMDFFDGP